MSKRDFDQMCFELNEVLNESNMFLRIYELKDKFRYLFHEQKQKKEVIRKISACIKNKFNGFIMTLSNSCEIEKKDFFSSENYLQTCEVARRCDRMLFFDKY